MFTRDYKDSGPGQFFHIYNRGNNKQNIFIEDQDFEFFSMRLKQNLYPERFKGLNIQTLPSGSFSLASHCLMPNHFHFLIRQNTEVSTSKLMLRVCSSYSKFFNKKYERVGHVFQDQFKQVPIYNDKQLRWLVSYICQNPKIAGIVNNLADYKWSSYPEYLSKKNDGLTHKELFKEIFKGEDDINFIETSYQIIKDNKIGQRIEEEL